MKAPTLPLAEICELLRNGKQISQSKSQLGLPITRIETISNHVVDAERVGYAALSQEDAGDYLLRSGDILFSHINSLEHIGKTAIYENVPERLVHGMNLLCIRVRQDVADPRYMLHAMRSDFVRAQVLRYTNKSVNQASISITNLRNLHIPLPPLPEQRRIAAILDKADALRAKRREAIAKLDQLLQSVFLGTMADAEQWPTQQLSDLCDESAPITYGILQPGPDVDDGIPYVRPSEIKEGKIVVRSLRRTTPQIARRYAKSALMPGDILITIVGTIGSIAVVPESLRGANITQSSARIRISPEKAEPRFVELFLRSSLARRQYEKARLGVAVERLNLHHVRDLEVPLPPTALQREVARAADKIEALHSLQAKSLSKLDALFAALTQQVFRDRPM